MLWMLKPIVPWASWYDKAIGFVIRASTAEDARKLASMNAGDEGRATWLNVEQTSCVELPQDGDDEVILRDFASA
jgi:hypothetical protein